MKKWIHASEIEVTSSMRKAASESIRNAAHYLMTHDDIIELLERAYNSPKSQRQKVFKEGLYEKVCNHPDLDDILRYCAEVVYANPERQERLIQLDYELLDQYRSNIWTAIVNSNYLNKADWWSMPFDELIEEHFIKLHDRGVRGQLCGLDLIVMEPSSSYNYARRWNR